MANHTHIEGLAELESQFRRLEKFPKSKVGKAANAGMKEPLKDAKANAPVDMGTLKKGIIKIKEKSPKHRAKVVYRVVFDRGFNHVFQKPIQNPGKYGGKKPTAYYPVSQEFGFRTSNHGYSPGFRFIQKALEQNQTASAKKIVDVLRKEVDKLLQ
ncbi:HK97 gp10 family phage protein [Neobacillus drentensis]|uniref:HK97 gp10 family phage protein n=1 Tax=Neobacillus drentensis TaxID=220684 RepID=UPI002FFDED53